MDPDGEAYCDMSGADTRFQPPHGVDMHRINSLRATERLIRERTQTLTSELSQVQREIRELEQQGFVQVQFHGHAKIYTYELRPGEPVSVGDFVSVYSPHSGQWELVRVVALGRGEWSIRNQTCAHKIARRITWSMEMVR